MGREGWIGSLLMRGRYLKGGGESTKDKFSLLFVVDSI